VFRGSNGSSVIAFPQPPHFQSPDIIFFSPEFMDGLLFAPPLFLEKQFLHINPAFPLG